MIGKRLLGEWTFLCFVDLIGRHFIPLFNVFDLDFANCDRSVTVLINPVLQLLKPLHHFLAESHSHVIKQRELTNAIEDCVDHFNIE